MIHRILVVDDHARWRRAVRSMLMNSTRWRIVGEAADGPEALQYANALRPDLILLDVELGTSSGIETAQQILAADAASRILFVSAHRSWAIVGAALATGANGYVLKADAGHELLTAIGTVAKGGRYLGAGLLGHALDRRKPVLEGRRRQRSHEAAFYRDEIDLLDDLARFTESALNGGKSVIVATTESRRAMFHDRLHAHGVDIDADTKEGRYRPLYVSELLSAIMDKGWPDETRFWKVGTSLLTQAASASPDDHPRLAAAGEGVSSLVHEGKLDAAMRLEQLWDEFARVCQADIFCPFLMTAHRRANEDFVRQISALHSAVQSA